MTAEDLAVRIPGGTRRRGDWYDARCPAHEDEHPSLSFRDEGSRVRVLCRAGCSPTAIALALGLRVPNLFDAAPAKPTSRSFIEYEYRDERGELLYVVERREPKSFRVRRPDGRGGWMWSLNDTRRVLYGLPLLREQDTVWVVEGEKDADRLRRIGIPATTNPAGAGKWRDDYAEQLRVAAVRCVAIVPDNDDVGEKLNDDRRRRSHNAGQEPDRGSSARHRWLGN